jgi:hypothetical protein
VPDPESRPANLEGTASGRGSAEGQLTAGKVLAAVRAVDPGQWTAVRDVLREAEADRITPDQAAERLIVSAPELEELLRQMQSWKDPKWWITTLLAVLAIAIALLPQSGGHLSEEDRRMLDRCVQQAEAEAEPNAPVARRDPPAGHEGNPHTRREHHLSDPRKRSSQPFAAETQAVEHDHGAGHRPR